MARPSNPYQKQRITIYAPQTVLDIISRFQKETGTRSITDTLCRIITEYGESSDMKRLEQMIEERFDDTISKVQDIKESNTILRERIGFLESTYSAVTCAVAETRPEYKKR